jgi:hypothetical protein
MNRTMKAALWAVGLGLSGCGTTGGFLRDSHTITEAEFKMEVGQIRYSRSVSGTAKLGEALCVIPLNDSAYMHAMENLYSQARLGPNEVLTNFREDSAFLWYLGFYCQKMITISADVLEVTPAGTTPTPPTTPAPVVPAGK